VRGGQEKGDAQLFSKRGKIAAVRKEARRAGRPPSTCNPGGEGGKKKGRGRDAPCTIQGKKRGSGPFGHLSLVIKGGEGEGKTN